MRAAACVLAVVTAGAARAAGPGAEIDAFLGRYAAAGKLNGTVLVAKDGKVLLEKGYGMASFELGVPNGPGTKVWLASVSKVFTAALVLRLADEGKLSLDDRVSDLLPWYRKDSGSRITVRQLLGHTSGIPDYLHLPGLGREGFRREAGDGLVETKAFAARFCSGDPAWEPGSRWGYDNSGYFLLGAIVEEVTRKPFDRALGETVLEPLGLKQTGDLAARPRAVVPGLASGYEWAAGRLVARRDWNLSTAFAAGSMYSTVGDLHRFFRALESDFLLPATRDAMFTEGLGSWGLGVDVRSLPVGPGRATRKVVGHEGYLFWVLTRVWSVPQDRLFVAILNNTGDVPMPAMFTGITDLIHGRTPPDPKASVAGPLRAALDASGPAAIAPRFRELKAKEPGAWDFEEKVVNGLGYGLLGERLAEGAVAAFRLNVEEHPASANAWDSLGEGLAIVGRKEEAAAVYRRALDLDPGLSSAAEALKRLDAESR